MEYKSLSKLKNWKCLWRDKLHWQRQCTWFTAEISKCLREINDHGCPKRIKSNNYFSPASVTIPLEYLDATFPENYLFKPYHSSPAKPDPKNIAKVSSNLGSTLWSWCSSELLQVQITSPAHTYIICRAGNSTCTEISKNVSILHNSLLKIRHHRLLWCMISRKRSLDCHLSYALESWKSQSSKLSWDEPLCISHYFPHLLSPLFFFSKSPVFHFFHQYLLSNLLQKLQHAIPGSYTTSHHRGQTATKTKHWETLGWGYAQRLDEALDLAKRQLRETAGPFFSAQCY